ncbi:hypothetical protein LRS74_18310 [Streptomyces sp. LX-29]|uniref:hypothetical protein n=1 Tax=Streptomyces sp. LX-29 TaxID=2900152 RepID=UPI00240E9557|nr:hypothetical protein [Streptomyces sp. LX-29]WFB08776.1 hypothetical protein LRS74_18310 [Streptomyces sp. LX-29]
MASPGFGKRAVSGQGPRRADDFAGLPAREAAIAAYVDRLPDGACISIKALAAQLPYGQCALGTALRRLAEAGHLRLFRERTEGGRWVTRTHFSRIARDDAWWAAYQAGRDTDQAAEGEPRTEGAAPPRPGYAMLARLGEADPRLALSAADCAALEPLAGEWLRRGASEPYVASVLTAGLPEAVHHPRRFLQARLTAKMPPERVLPAPRPAPVLMECAVCRAPGSPQALPGGVCRDCRGEGAAPGDRRGVDVRAYADGIRTRMRQRPRAAR